MNALGTAISPDFVNSVMNGYMGDRYVIYYSYIAVCSRTVVLLLLAIVYCCPQCMWGF